MTSVGVPHVFLTRFNVASNQVERSILTDEWLRERSALFERYTVPSVLAQPAEGRHWLIFLSPDSPDWLKQRMGELEDGAVAHPVYLDRALTPEHLRSLVREVTGLDSGRVTTSNLDNDDGLSSGFLTQLRAVPVGATPAVVTLTNGLVRGGDDAVFLQHDPTNAFSVVVDDVGSEEFAYCWSARHTELGRLMPALRVDGPPAWLQVVHGRNVSNRVRGRLTSPARHRAGFGTMLDDLPEPGRFAFVRDRLAASPVRQLREKALPAAGGLVRRLLGEGTLERIKIALRRGQDTGRRP